MGLDSGNGFSSNADELNSAANFYHNTVIVGFQNQILKVLHKIFKVNDMDMPVQFVQLKPITTKFTNQDLASVLTPDEIREEMGYEPLDVDVEVREDFSKVGMVDGKPVFSTIEEAEAHAKTLGCEGYHEHDLDGTTAYMACKDHSEATELSKWIEEFGEDIPEDWELVEEEIVDGEHQDFDFEEVLNDAASEKIELASTGSPKPGRKSEQDGLSKKSGDYFRVRYVYENDNFLTNKSGSKRKFCTQMMGANKLYRKEDIVQMEYLEVNKGWGPKGDSATYSIWLYKGGGNCFHYWKRQVFKTSLRNAKSKISDRQFIESATAISEGFTAKKNDKLVATPPRKMKNNGYYN